MSLFYCVLVVYNSDIQASSSYQFLKKKGVQVIVCDNSDQENQNKNIVEDDGFSYISMHGNKGLSKAYNVALDYIQSIHPSMDGYLVLFDDDTKVEDDYFEKMECSTGDICLPVVYDEKSLLSPSMFKKGKSIRVSSIQEIDMDFISGINSGMCINLSIFKEYRYNESLFLDYIDHYFLYEMKKQSKKIEVVDTKLLQRFSANSNSKNSALNRFQIFKKRQQGIL